uniref:Uncharacterized protein n=1 Tax=Panagrolaimus sp. ES5 TaxID=591445 RepID=A0AC34GNB3_9BILA
MEWLLLDFYQKEAKYGHISKYPVADDDNSLLRCKGPENLANKTLVEAAKALFYKEPIIQAQTAAFTNNRYLNQSFTNLSICAKRHRHIKKYSNEVEQLYVEA